MKRIELSNEEFTLVDDWNFEKLSQYNFHVMNTWAGNKYVYRWNPYPKAFLLHREIMNAPEGMVVDHKNHNFLDNREENLRVVTFSANAHNRKEKARGYYWETARNKYYVSIMVEGKKILLGRVNTEAEAIILRREAELKYYPEIYGG